MKQNLVNLGQKLTNFINLKLQDSSISKEEYIKILETMEIMAVKELKRIENKIIENKGWNLW